MQVFKAFFRIVNKNKMSLLMYIVIYLALTLMIGKFMEKTRIRQPWEGA